MPSGMAMSSTPIVESAVMVICSRVWRSRLSVASALAAELDSSCVPSHVQ